MPQGSHPSAAAPLYKLSNSPSSAGLGSTLSWEVLDFAVNRWALPPRRPSSAVHGQLFKGSRSADKAEHLNTRLSS